MKRRAVGKEKLLIALILFRADELDETIRGMEQRMADLRNLSLEIRGDIFRWQKQKSRTSEKKWHWPYLRTNSNGAKEYACKHGIGHGGLHGCDGCCHDPSFPKNPRAAGGESNG